MDISASSCYFFEDIRESTGPAGSNFEGDGGYEGPVGPVECDDSAGTLAEQQLESCKAICKSRECCFHPVHDGGCYNEDTI